MTSSVGKSHRHSVCPDETVVYKCTSSSERLTWNIYSERNSDRTRIIEVSFYRNDTLRIPFCLTRSSRSVATEVLVILLNVDNLQSQLLLPYTPEWSGSMIVCGGGETAKGLEYIIAGCPIDACMCTAYHIVILFYTIIYTENPPVPQIFSLKEPEDDVVQLQWNDDLSADYDISYFTIKIANESAILLNVSYSSALLKLSANYTKDAVSLELYSVNKCEMQSTESAVKTLHFSGMSRSLLLCICYLNQYGVIPCR